MTGLYIDDFEKTISEIIRRHGKEALLNRKLLNELVQNISKTPQTCHITEAFSCAGIFKRYIDASDSFSKSQAYKASNVILTEDFMLSEDISDLYLNALAKILWNQELFALQTAAISRKTTLKQFKRTKTGFTLICIIVLIMTICGWHFILNRIFVSAASLQRNADGYLIIHDARELAAMKTALNEKYIISNDIDLSNTSWTPIGSEDNPFTGELYGAGNQIKGLVFDGKVESNAYYGLFGFTKNATIRDLQIDVNEKVETESNSNDAPTFLLMGGIAGTLDSSTVDNCIITGSISGSAGNNVFSRTGLVCGQAINSSITNCDISGDCSAQADNMLNSMAGLAAAWMQDSTISDCIFQGSVNANGNWESGTDSNLIGYAGSVAGSGSGSTIDSCIINNNTSVVSAVYADAISPVISSVNCYICSNVSVASGTITEAESENQKSFDSFDGVICQELQWDEGIWKYAEQSRPLLKTFYSD